MKLYFIVVLIFISQMTDEIKQLFMSFTPIFSFKNSMVLALICRSMTYFKLIFVYDL